MPSGFCQDSHLLLLSHLPSTLISSSPTVQCLIEEFQAGYLPIREGTSLRNFLSKMLNCKPKRISKKFEGSDYNGKQVYASQPYKLTANEARERRDRLCSLERKFHQSVAELKSVEGMKQHQQQQQQQQPGGAGIMGLGGMDGSMNHNDLNASASSLSNLPSGSMVGMGGMSHNSNNSNSNMLPNDIMTSNSNMSGGTGGGPGQNNQYLEELAFQESMFRLRQQQQQQMQQQNSNAGGQNGGIGQGGDGGNNNNSTNTNNNSVNQSSSGSYVDPILGNRSMGQNTMNTTPMAASQFWRRQALLDASSHMDSLRMAQSGAVGIQRPPLEPGGMRDLRVPSNLMMMGGMNGGMPDDFSQQQMEGGKDVDGGGMFKKRPVDSSSSNDGMMKRIRRSNNNDTTTDGQQQQQQGAFYN